LRLPRRPNLWFGTPRNDVNGNYTADEDFSGYLPRTKKLSKPQGISTYGKSTWIPAFAGMTLEEEGNDIDADWQVSETPTLHETKKTIFGRGA
jgi:hypothetical protein